MENLLHIGYLDYSMTEDEIEDFFSKFGEVEEVRVLRGRGIGFVRMSTATEAEKAKKEFEDEDSLYKGGYLDMGKTLRTN